MDQSSKKFSASLGLVAVGVIIAIVGFYLYATKKTPQDSKDQLEIVKSDKKPTAFTFNADQRAEIQQIFLESIREKPDLFINAMNDGVQAQQDKLRVDMEKAASLKSKELLESAIVLGSTEAKVKLIALVDPLCPHCQNFERIALNILQKRQDVAFYLVPVSILGANSAMIAKAMIAASKQGTDKLNAFIQHMNDKKGDIDTAKLTQIVKAAALDAVQFEKDINGEAVQKQLLSNTAMAESLKIPGVPTIFGVQSNGELTVVPPMDINGFNQLIDNIKADKPLTEGFNPVKENTDES